MVTLLATAAATIMPVGRSPSGRGSTDVGAARHQKDDPDSFGSGSPSVGAAEYLFDCNLCCLVFRELLRPWHPLVSLGTRAGVAVFGVACGLLILRLAPVV